MKNKAGLIAIIIIVLFLQLAIQAAKVFSSHAWHKVIEQSNTLLTTIQVNNVLLFLVVLFSIGLLVSLFSKWNNLEYYKSVVLKWTKIIGYMFIVEGIFATVLYFATTSNPIFREEPFSVLWLGSQECLFIILGGLLFLLVGVGLETGKMLKEENDLTI